PAKPPQLYEYFLDNFWFEAADLEHQQINAPLKGSHKADIVIVGGGFTGLSSAYHLSRRFPNKHIVLLGGSCCGYGASGRNGGFCDAGFSGLMAWVDKVGPELGRKAFDASLYGIGHIKRLVAEHGVACDFEENGVLKAALLHGKELEAEIRSPRYLAALKFPYGGILNPAKLARGIKPLVERAGVEVRERTLVMRVTPGKVHRVETEMGDISAPVLVLALNGYSPRLGFFRDRVLPLCSYVIATEPLTKAQWESIGWK